MTRLSHSNGAFKSVYFGERKQAYGGKPEGVAYVEDVAGVKKD